MTEPRAYTPEECCEMLLDRIRNIIAYWAGEGPSNVPKEYGPRQRCEGVAHSLLSNLDGCGATMPAFLVTPMPHHDDKAYDRERGKNWWPTDKPDLGMLHELLFKKDMVTDKKQLLEILKVGVERLEAELR